MNLGRRRAKDALKRVKDIADRSDKFKEKYRSYVDRLGPAIVMNGLGQALATERAGAGTIATNDQQHAHHELYRNLNRWLCGEGGVYNGGDLLDVIVSNDEASYLYAQAEALAWLEWHKKFCRAYLMASHGGTM